MNLTVQEISLALFVLNWVLIVGDASLGYFLLPLVLPPRSGQENEEEQDKATLAVGGMRRLLTVMVSLYMLVNCYAFYQGHSTLLYLVTAIVLLDIIAQLVLRRFRLRRG
jgi:hypothetical protein